MSGEGEGEAGRDLQVEHVRVRGRVRVRVSDLQVKHVRRGGASHAAVELALIAVEVGGDRVPLGAAPVLDETGGVAQLHQQPLDGTLLVRGRVRS